MTLAECCSKDVVMASPDSSVVEAARLMEERNVGSIIVTEEERPVGIVTDRDIALRVIAQGKRPEETTIRDVMTPDPVTLNGNMEIFEAIEYVTREGIRRLPIVEADGRLVGIITLDDVIGILGKEMSNVSEAIEKNRPNL
jgi:CBS domain-containing protein